MLEMEHMWQCSGGGGGGFLWEKRVWGGSCRMPQLLEAGKSAWEGKASKPAN